MSRIDRPPGKLLRWFYRAPIHLYRAGFGRFMSKRLLMLTHIGRKSGQPRHAVLEVTRHDVPGGTFFVPAAYGPRAHWYRNLLATPEAEVNHQGKRIEVRAEVVPAEIAAAEFARYADTHPRSAQSLGRLMGFSFDDPAAVAAQIPLVALRSR